MLQEQHLKYVQFRQHVSQELVGLRQELQTLLTEKLVPDNSVLMQSGTPGQPVYSCQTVSSPVPAMSGYPQHGNVTPVPGQHTSVGMDVDQTSNGFGPGFQLPNINQATWNYVATQPHTHVPCSMPDVAPQPVVQPVVPPFVQPVVQPVAQMGASQPMMHQSQAAMMSSPPVARPEFPPPGNWEEPQQYFPNPVYKVPQVQTQHSVNVIPMDQVRSQLPVFQDPEIQAAVGSAAQALNSLPAEQGGTGGHGLTPQQRQQLMDFAKQQEQCQQQLQHFKEQAQSSLHPQVVPATPMPAAVPQTPTLPVHADTFSINSSPAKTNLDVAGLSHPDQYQLSPPGQRKPKVAKTRMGHLHLQESVNSEDGLCVSVPASPTESARSPTPVPTEIAEDSIPFLEKDEQLHKLE